MSKEVFKLNPKQDQAVDIAADPTKKHIMFYGGSRSGKTFLACYLIFLRAAKVKSRHCILRFKFAHAIQSIWLDTIPKMLSVAMPDLVVTQNKSRYFYTLPHNGSEVWVGGLDNAERAEKILGNEYSTIYFNECSQLSYLPIQTARTRLAEKNSLRKLTYYDQNPPKKNHWSYWVFEKKLNPSDNEPIKHPETYASILMNPKDNIDNIDDEYLEILKAMPEAERNRFLLGLYSDESDGQVYYAFKREEHVFDERTQPKQLGTVFIGMDFNVNPMTATITQVINGTFFVMDEVFLENSDTFRMCAELRKRGYFGTVIPDSTGKNRKTSGKSDFDILKESGFRIPSVRNPFVTDRVNNVNRLFNSDRIKISSKCNKLINDLEKVQWKNNKLDQKTDPMLSHISDTLGYTLWHLDPIQGVRQSISIDKYM